MKCCIVMPAYNEEKRIGETLKAYSLFLNSKLKEKDFDYNILIVINGTTDRTEEIVKAHIKKNKRIRHLNLVKGGKGYALIEGFKEALRKDCDLIGFVDADMATPAEAFYDLIKNIKGYDSIIASRYVEGAVVNPKQPFSRILASRVFNLFVRSLFLMPYRDTQCGAKIMKRKALESIISELGETHWSFDIDLLYRLKKQRFSVKEHATSWQDKTGSKLNLKKASIQMFFSVIQLRVLNSPFRRVKEVAAPAIRIFWRRLK